MYSLEDRIYFDGAAAETVTTLVTDDSSSSASSSSDTSGGSSATSTDTSGGSSSSATTTDSSSDTSTDTGSSSVTSADIDALIDSILNTDTASSDTAHTTLVISSAVENAGEIATEAEAHNITVVTYDPTTETLQDLFDDIQTALNGDSASSISFVTVDNSGEGFSLVSASVITEASLTLNGDVSNFFAETSSLLADGGRLMVSGDNSLTDSASTALETAIADVAGVKISFIDALNGDITTAAPGAMEYNIIFIDASVTNASDLLKNLSANTEVYYMDSSSDGLSQITKDLEGKTNVDSIQIILHGNSEALLFGSTALNKDNVSSYSEQLAGWGKSLTSDGDILIYSCNTAETGAGKELVNDIASLTGHDVAASADITGGSNGNWTLEYSTGAIGAAAAFDGSDYHYQLTGLKVTSTGDNGADGTLRYAVNYAIANGGEVYFDYSLSGLTITLDSSYGAIAISSGSVTINEALGDLSSAVTISSSFSNCSVFTVSGNASLNIIGGLSSNLITITTGSTAYSAITVASGCSLNATYVTFYECGSSSLSKGGAIYVPGTPNTSTAVVTLSHDTFQNCYALSGGAVYNNGILSVENCTFVNNGCDTATSANVYGGAIYSSGDGSITVDSCLFSNNSIYSNGGNAYGGAIYSTTYLSATNCTFHENWGLSSTQSTYGGAIYVSSGTLDSCTIVDNRADGGFDMNGYGGGIAVFFNVNMYNMIVVNNSAKELGNDVYVDDSDGSISGAYNVVQSFYSKYDTQFTSGTDIVFNSNTGTWQKGGVDLSNQTLGIGDVSYTGGFTNTVAVTGDSFLSSSEGAGKSGGTDGRGYYRVDSVDGGTTVYATRGAWQYNGAVAYVGTEYYTTINNACNAIPDGGSGTVFLAGTAILESGIDVSGSGTKITIQGQGSSETYVQAAESAGGSENCILTSNGCELTINDMTIRYGGSGISSSSAWDLTMNRVNVCDNSSEWGGCGVYSGIGNNHSGTSYLNDCTISNNNGSGVYCNGSFLYLTNCTLINNSAAGNGGGLYFDIDSNGDNSSATITNCTFLYNHSGGKGGAICMNTSESVTLDSCTIAYNYTSESSGKGGGVYVGYLYYGSANVKNTIMTDNYLGTLATPNDFYFGEADTHIQDGTLSDQGSNVVKYSAGYNAGAGKFTQGTDILYNSGTSKWYFYGGSDLANQTLGLDTTLTYTGGYTNVLTLSGSSFLLGDASTAGSTGQTTDGRGYYRAGTVDGGTTVLTTRGAWQYNPAVAHIDTSYYTTIQKAYDAAADGNTIVLAGSAIIESGITFDENKTITVQGQGMYSTCVQGYTIAGIAESRIFSVSGTGSVTFEDMSVRYGVDTSDNGGGGIYFTSTGNLTLDSVNIAYNSTGCRGGGVSFNSDGNLTLDNCTFIGNSANEDNTIIVNADAGGLYFSSVGYITVNACTFIANITSGNSGGFLIGANENVTLNDCMIVSNKSGGGGGGFQFTGSASLTLNNCTVSYNGSSGSGGAISFEASVLVLNNCTVSGNGSLAHAGGICFSSNSSLTLGNTTISGNTSVENGAGVYSEAGATSITIYGCTISGNQASGYAGGLSIGSCAAVAITDCTFDGNKSLGYNAYGGAIYISGSTVAINSSTFTNNAAISYNSSAYAYGGALYITSSSKVSMTNCTFGTSGNGNTVSGSASSSGGAVYVSGESGSPSTLVSTNCTFTANTAGTYGGAIYASEYTNSTINNCTFVSNSLTGSGGGGGAIAFAGYSMTLDSCTIAYNTVTGGGNGGGIYELNSSGSTTLTVKNTILTGNTVSGSGNDFYRASGTLTDNGYNVVKYQSGSDFSNSTDILYNSGTSTWQKNGSDLSNQTLGLALSLTYTGGFMKTLAVTGGFLSASEGAGSTNNGTDERGYYRVSTVNGATAYTTRGAWQYNGAVAYIGSSYYTTIQNALDAAVDGDTVYLAGTAILESGINCNKLNTSITIQGQGTSVTYVQAAESAGTATDRVFSLYLFAPTLNDMTIRYGNVTGDGGGIYFEGYSLTLNRVDLSSNSASANGGAIRIVMAYSSGGTETFNDCTFSNNTASGSGGAIYSTNEELSITNCTFYNNAATSGDGGAIAIYAGDYSSMTMTNCTIAYNHCDDNGGAIYSTADVTLYSCTIAYNHTDESNGFGGGVYINGSALTIENTIMVENYLGVTTSSDDIYYIDSTSLSNLGYNVVKNQSGWTQLSNSTDILYVYDSETEISTWQKDGVALSNQNMGLSEYLTYTGGYTKTLSITGDGFLAASEGEGSTDYTAYPATDGRGYYRVDSVDGGTAVLTTRGAWQNNAAVAYINETSEYYTTIQKAYDAAASSDTIVLANSTICESGITFSSGKTVTLEAALNESMEYGLTYIQPSEFYGGSVSRVFSISGSDSVTFSYVNIRFGMDFSGNGGGGIYFDSSGTLTLNNSNISHNFTTENGGGVYNNSGTLELTDTVSFTGNTALTDTGDAIYNAATMNLNSCTLNVAENSPIYNGSTFNAETSNVVYMGTMQTVTPLTYYNLLVNGSGVKTAGGSINVENDLTVGSSAIFATSTNTVTVTGTSDINGTLTISTGTFDANGAFDATGGAVTFTGAGNLYLSSTVTSLGTFTCGTSTVTYDGAAQNVDGVTYYNLMLNGSGIKTAGGTINVGNNLTVATGVTFALGTNTCTVTGTSDINGTLTISTGTFDANGTFDATDGTLTFTGAGNLYLGGTVTSFGVFTVSTSTITYDGAAQNVLTPTYYNLTIGGSGIKTAGGTINVGNNLTVASGATFALGTNTANVTGASDINGTLTISTGTLDTDGSFDATGGVITFSDSGNLCLAGTVLSLGTFTASTSTVTYNGAAQNVATATYYNLTLSGSGTKTAAGTIAAGNNLTLNTGITFAVDTRTVTITGTSDINGTLTVSTGTFDANGSFDATSGNVTFTGVGNLKLAGTVTSLGTFTCGTSTVTYDGGNQTVLAESYYTLSFYGSTSGSTKTFADGTTKVGTEIYLNETITLTGSSKDNVTVQVTDPGLDGTASRVFYMCEPTKTITIENMTIKGGDISSSSGGGIYIQAGTGHLYSVVITGSKASGGGGIASLGTLTMENCTVSSCTSSGSGGGINAGGTLTMENCTVSSCTSSDSGSGINFSGTSLILENCTISNNNGYSAISLNGGALTMVNCTISNNDGGEYGAICVDSDTVLTITDSTIAGNALYYGIFLYMDSNSLYLTNSIVAYNYYYNNESDYGYSDIAFMEECPIYGNYNILGNYDLTATGTGNVYYTYTNGKGASLFESYTQILADAIYRPDLADNGGSTYTVALASDSIAAEAGCLTGYYDDSGTTKYAFSSDGTNWYAVEDGSSVGSAVTEITTDQRGVSISGTPSIGSYYSAAAPSSYYYRSNVDGSGNWSVAANWEWSTDQTTWTTATVAPDANNSVSITIRNGDSMTVNSSISVDQTTIESTGAIVVSNGITLTVADGTGTDLTSNGSVTVDGSGVLLVASGAAADVNSTFAVSGTLSFDDSGADNGTLSVSSSSITIANLIAGNGTISYDGTDQTIASATYYNLASNSGVKTAGGDITIENSLTVAAATAFAAGTHNVTINGASDINGTLTVSTGTFDANGAFDATGGNVTFTGAGNLQLGGTVTSLGTFTASTSTVTYNGGNQTIAAANYNTLSFDGSTSGSTKTFADGTTSVGTQISLSDSITLSGSSSDDVTVQVTDPGSTNSRVFYVNAAGKTVNIEDMTVKGGRVTAGSGGAMYINSGTVNLDGVIVSGSSAQAGGAGYIAANATLNVIDSTIDNNATIIQVGVDCYGGAFYNIGTLNIQNSTLSNNTAKLGGAIFNASAGGVGVVSITSSSQITNNSATGSGGAIYNEKTLTVDSSTISGNTATDGGAIISWNNTTITDSTISNNTANSGNGGAIYNGATLELNGTNSFSGNSASSNNGDAIYNSAAGNIIDLNSSTLNIAEDSAIYNNGGTFTADSSTVNYNGADQTILAATYYNLTTSGSGTKTAGGNIVAGNNLTVSSGTTFAAGANTVTVTGTSDINGTLTVSTGTLDANGAFDATGGNVTFTGAGNLQLGGTVTSLGTFTASTSTVTYNGGNQTIAAANYNALSFDGSTSGSTKTFADGTTSVGTQISLTDTITLTGSSQDNVTVQVTTPGSSGTASRVFYIDASGETVTVSNMTVKGGNISGSSQNGGSILVNAGTLALSSSTVSGSKAYEGGGIYVDTNGTLSLTNSSVTGNTATNPNANYGGGGIANVGTISLISDSTVSSNTSTDGAGILNRGGTITTIQNSTISNNTSSNDGGGIHNESGSIGTIQSCTVTGNTSQWKGAGICAEGDANISTISNCTIAYNNVIYSDGWGGGICVGPEGTTNNTTIRNSIIAGNTRNGASSAGADYYYTASTVVDGGYNVVGYSNVAANATGGFNAATSILYNTKYNNGGTSFTSWTQGGTAVSGSLDLSSSLANNGGSTQTLALATSSFAAASIPSANNWNDSPLIDGDYIDQRGYIRTSGQSTSAGAYAITCNDYRTSASGNWSNISIWEMSTDGGTTWIAATEAPNASNSVSITILSAHSVTVNSSISIDQTSVEGSLIVADGITLTVANGTGTDLTSSGSITVNNTGTAGTLLFASGASADINSTFTVNGILSFDDSSGADNGTMNVSTANITVASLTAGSGTITYDGAAQNVVSATYYNLTLSNSGIKTVAGTINVGNDLTVATGVTFAVGTYTVTITGVSDINGTLTVSTGTFDANGAFDATGGNVTFTGSGNLQLGGTVTSLGTFTASTSTVTYDGGNQTIAAANYYMLSFTGSTSGSTKIFADGTTSVATQISLADSITLNGSSASAVTVQVTTPGSGGTASRVFYINASDKNVTIENMTVKGGDISSLTGSSSYGGAIYVAVGTVNLNSLVFTGSKAAYGGAIYVNGGTVAISGSIFGGADDTDYSSANTATYGGAIYIASGYTATLNNCKFYYNSATTQGGAICNEGTVTFSGSSEFIFTGNKVTSGNGGAIYSSGTISESSFTGSYTFTGNTASSGNGGAIYVDGGTETLTNATFGNVSDSSSHNSAIAGGAVYVNGGTLNLSGANFYYNVVSGTKGGAIYIGNNGSAAISGTCAVNGNTANFGSFVYLSIDAGSLTLSSSTITSSDSETIYVENGNGGIIITGDNTLNGITIYLFDTLSFNSSGAASLTLGDGSIFNSSSTGTISGDANDTLSFTGSDSSILPGGTVGTVVVNRTACADTITMDANFTITNTLTLTSGIFTIGANTLTLEDATLTIVVDDMELKGGANSAMSFTGTGDAVIPIITDGLGTLTINRAGGFISLDADLAINTLLTLTAGYVNLGNYNISLGIGTPLAGTSSSTAMAFTNGTGLFIKYFAAADNNFTFPVGTYTSGIATYSPITINFTSATYGANAYVSVIVTEGKESHVTVSSYISRYWTVASNDISSFSTTITATYAAGDVTGTESALYGELYTTKWNQLEKVNTTAHTFTGTVTEFGNFTASGNTSPTPVPTPSNNTVPETNIDMQPQEPTDNGDVNNNLNFSLYPELRIMIPNALTREEMTFHNRTWNEFSPSVISSARNLADGEWGVFVFAPLESDSNNPVILDESESFELGATGTDGMEGDYSAMAHWSSKYEKHPLFKSKVDTLLDALITQTM